jgi:AcrR family transcriptional regulator
VNKPVTSATRQVPDSSRRRLPRDERSKQLLETAEAVFSERGVHATSMEEIADRAGVTKPVLYDHYGSKDRLVAAVVERAGSVLAAAVLDAVTAAVSPEVALVQGLQAYFAFIEERRAGLRALLTEGVVPGSEAALALERVRTRQADLIAALLVEQVADPDPVQAQIYAQIVVGATERLATQPDAPAYSVEVLTRHVMDVIWCGFDRLKDGDHWNPAAAV